MQQRFLFYWLALKLGYVSRQTLLRLQLYHTYSFEDRPTGASITIMKSRPAIGCASLGYYRRLVDRDYISLEADLTALNSQQKASTRAGYVDSTRPVADSYFRATPSYHLQTCRTVSRRGLLGVFQRPYRPSSWLPQSHVP
jgi:hypothetical protein